MTNQQNTFFQLIVSDINSCNSWFLPYRYGKSCKTSLVSCVNLCLPHPSPQYTHHTHHRSTHPGQVWQTPAGHPGRTHTIQGHLSRHTLNPTSPHRRACNYKSKHTIPIQYPSNLTTFHIRTNLNTLRSLRPLRCMILVTAKSAKSAKIVWIIWFLTIIQ